MKITRRDLLTWGGGLTAGALLTPVPWKLVDDSAIWTQNWPWIPQPAHGPVEVRRSFCTLCPQGCGMRVRMAGGCPVGVSGMPDHPVTRGALCPLAFGAHQLNWHPRRLRQVLHRGKPASWTDALAAFRRACAEGPVALVDGWRGRAASEAMRMFARRQGGSYQVLWSAEERGLQPYANWSGMPVSRLGYDLENARTVVSFGTPLLDGWGSPGRFTHLWAERAAGQSDPSLRLMQIEPAPSRTGGGAWRRVPIREASEASLAGGLARVLLEERLVAAHGPMPPASVEEAAAETGLSQDAIRELARTLVERRPALAIAADEEPAVAALNVLLGGGIVCRPAAFPQSAEGDGARASRAVVIDASVPWDFAPAGGAEVFRFAAWDGGGSRADWLLPAPGFVEELTDIPAAPGSAIETYAVAPQLAGPVGEVRSAAAFLAQADPAVRSVEAIIQTRCRRLWPADEKAEGLVWSDASRPRPLNCRLSEWPAQRMAPRHFDSYWHLAVLPPLAAKLYQESNLRPAPERRNV